MSEAFESLKRRLERFVDEREWRQFHTPKNMAICISVEANELLAHYTWTDTTAVEETSEQTLDHIAIRDEAADILLSLLSFARTCDFDLIDAAQTKLTKLEKRYDVRTARGNARKIPESESR